MINQTLLWLLVLPVVFGIILFTMRRGYRDIWMYCIGYALIGVLITTGLFFIAKNSKTMDTEIWNGKVVSKERSHGTYEEAYECNCRQVPETTTRTVTDSNGKSRTVTETTYVRKCDTCYRTHYTVSWDCHTTVGSYQIEKYDETSRSVYNSPDPQRYTIIKNGDPVARSASYTNYVQAVPSSLFTPASADLKKKFAGLIPPYPDNIYDFYKLKRFITPGWAPGDAEAWNNDISMGLRDLGPLKQVNLIIVVAKTDDANYEYALRDAWDGANKNDVVLLIGSTAYPKIDFVRVISWTKSELFKVELRDMIEEKGTIDRGIVPLALQQIGKNFERRRMREFQYLDGEIDPPDWVIYLILIIVTGGAVGFYFCDPRYLCEVKSRLR